MTEPTLEQLHAIATTAAQHAYAPYSHFRVGAALLLTTGEIVTGTNVENGSYGLALCAEHSAVVRAVAEYGPQIRIAAVAITNLNQAASPPCGACRQVLAEFTEPDAPIMFPMEGGQQTVPFREVFPFSFRLDRE